MKINESFSFLFNSNHRFVVLKGGAGSGKSYALAQYVFLSLLNANIKCNWLILRKVANTLKNSVFALVVDIIQSNKAEHYFHINKSDKTIECKTGNRIIMLGLDDREKIKSVYGIDKIWLEESSEFSQDDFLQLNLRLRGEGEKKQYYLSFNPIDVEHWIKKYFFDGPPEDTYLHESTYKDNCFLDQDYINQLEALIDVDDYYYKVYCLGEWGKISKARVFHNLVIEDFEYNETNLQNVSYGMDFGFIHASTLMSIGFKEDHIYVFDELYFKELTNTEFISKVEESGFDKRKTVKADSAEPDRIKEFKQAGFNVHASKKGKGSLKDGIDFLKNYTIHIHRTRCPNAVREFQIYKRRELKDGTITEDFLEENDDTIAAVRYAIEDLWSKRTQHQTAPSISKGALFGKRTVMKNGVASNKFIKND